MSDTLELKSGYVSKLQHKTEKKTPGVRKLVEKKQAEKQHWVSTTKGRAIVFLKKKKSNKCDAHKCTCARKRRRKKKAGGIMAQFA